MRIPSATKPCPRATSDLTSDAESLTNLLYHYRSPTSQASVKWVLAAILVTDRVTLSFLRLREGSGDVPGRSLALMKFCLLGTNLVLYEQGFCVADVTPYTTKSFRLRNLTSSCKVPNFSSAIDCNSAPCAPAA